VNANRFEQLFDEVQTLCSGEKGKERGFFLERQACTGRPHWVAILMWGVTSSAGDGRSFSGLGSSPEIAMSRLLRNVRNNVPCSGP
jgi:hypothetical protein